jgi:DNA-binding response OmpR family regulator
MMNGKDVLVVEDDPDINELVGAYVQMAGFAYRAAHDGATALRQVSEHKPSLIVMDLMLPDTDGMEVCRQLKANPNTRQIPVLVLTALDQEEQRAQGRACGLAAYMTKPFDPDDLMDTIRRTASVAGEKG